jgi:hypothetical protein
MVGTSRVTGCVTSCEPSCPPSDHTRRHTAHRSNRLVEHHDTRKSDEHASGEALDQQQEDRGGLDVSVVTDTVRNGVDTEKLFATLDLIKAQPELAKFQFRATNRWIDGAHNRSAIKGFC